MSTPQPPDVEPAQPPGNANVFYEFEHQLQVLEKALDEEVKQRRSLRNSLQGLHDRLTVLETVLRQVGISLAGVLPQATARSSNDAVLVPSRESSR